MDRKRAKERASMQRAIMSSFNWLVQRPLEKGKDAGGSVKKRGQSTKGLCATWWKSSLPGCDALQPTPQQAFHKTTDSGVLRVGLNLLEGTRLISFCSFPKRKEKGFIPSWVITKLVSSALG